MGILDRLNAGGQSEIETTGHAGDSLRWRIQRVDSARLASAGLTAMRLLSIEPAEELDPREAQAMLRRVSPADLEQMRREQLSLVCAAVTAIYDDESEAWESVTLVQGDGDIQRKRLPLSRLPPGHEDDLLAQIDAFQASGEVGLDALRTFRSTSRGASPDRSGGDEIRATTERGGEDAAG